MPKKQIAKETVAAAKPQIEVASKPRVKSVKHSKAAAVAVVAGVVVNAHDKIATIAYGYWVSRGFQPGSPEQDWLRAEQEYRRIG